MRTPIFTNRFRKDIRLSVKRNFHMEILKAVTRQLIDEMPLAPKHRDHPLQGEYQDCRECHLSPDWLLIYRITGAEIHFLRTGTHSDLF